MKDLVLDLQALRENLVGQTWKSHETTARASTGGATKSQSSAKYLVAQVGRHKVSAALAVCALALVTVGAWWALRNRTAVSSTQPPVAAVQRPFTRLTFGSGLQTDVTWSPDGRFIAYASDKAGNFDIWVQPIAGGDALQVTHSPAQDIQPAWSPDGSTLVFRSDRGGGGLYLACAVARRRGTPTGQLRRISILVTRWFGSPLPDGR
jgi:hypothetical protein